MLPDLSGGLGVGRDALGGGVDDQAAPSRWVPSGGVGEVVKDLLDERKERPRAIEDLQMRARLPGAIAVERSLIQLWLAAERGVQAGSRDAEVLGEIGDAGRFIPLRPEELHRPLEGQVGVEVLRTHPSTLSD